MTNNEGQLYPPSQSAEMSLSFVIPEVTKTFAAAGDYLVLFDSDEVLYKITKANFLAGWSSGGSNGGNTPVPTSPPVTSGLVAWMDASHAASTANTGQWLDRSGNNNNTGGTNGLHVSTNALNGKNVISFDTGASIGWSASPPLLNNDAFTILTVAKNRAINNGGVLLSQYVVGHPGRTVLYIGRNDLLACIYVGSAGAITEGDPYNPDFDIYCYQKIANSVTCQINNSPVSSQQVTSPIASLTTVLGGDCALDVAEILIYSQAITTQEIADTKAYLSAKWGV